MEYILGILVLLGGVLYMFQKAEKVNTKDPFKGQVDRLEEKLEELENNKPEAGDKSDEEVVDFWRRELCGF